MTIPKRRFLKMLEAAEWVVEKEKIPLAQAKDAIMGACIDESIEAYGRSFLRVDGEPHEPIPNLYWQGEIDWKAGRLPDFYDVKFNRHRLHPWLNIPFPEYGTSDTGGGEAMNPVSISAQQPKLTDPARLAAARVQRKKPAAERHDQWVAAAAAAKRRDPSVSTAEIARRVHRQERHIKDGSRPGKLPDQETISLTASLIRRPWPVERSCAAWAARHVSGAGDDESSAHGRDRVGDVTFGPEGRRRGVGNLGVRQVPRGAGRYAVRRGESSPVRRSGIRRPRCRAWHDGGSRASRGLHNVRARALV